MNLGQFLTIIWARRWVALLVFVLTVGVTVGVSLMLPKQYQGSATVVIDARPDPVSVMAGVNPMALPSFMATQVDILLSDRVAARVIQDLKLNENPALRDQWQSESKGQGSFEQWITELLQRQLEVKPSRESNVITVNFRAAEPKFAAGMANAFAQAYIATTLELRSSPARGFKTLFDEQTREAREALERAQGKLSAFQREKGIIANDERFDIENSRLSELSTQLTMIQAQAAESSSRQAQAQGAQQDRIQEVLNNPLIAQLKADQSRSESKLQELTSRLGDNHPQVVEARANIAEMRRRIDAETQRVTGGVGVANTINRSREQQVERELAAQRAKVLQLKAVRDEGLLLQRDVETAQRIYENLTVRQSQTTLETQNQQSFAHQLTVAQPPVLPASPRMFLNTVLSVVFGTVLAIGLAFALELTDRRVRSAADIVQTLGLPVLGTLSGPSERRLTLGRGPSSGMSAMRLEHKPSGQ